MQRYVANGVEILDRALPGWHKKIDVASLNMAMCDKCILGQCYGWYETGLHILDLDGDYAYLFGFDTPPHQRDVTHDDLMIEWITAIKDKK